MPSSSLSIATTMMGEPESRTISTNWFSLRRVTSIMLRHSRDAFSMDALPDQHYKVNITRSILQGQYYKVNITRSILQGQHYKVNITRSILHGQYYKVNIIRSILQGKSYKAKQKNRCDSDYITKKSRYGRKIFFFFLLFFYPIKSRVGRFHIIFFLIFFPLYTGSRVSVPQAYIGCFTFEMDTRSSIKQNKSLHIDMQ
jgi:hypothetical protein